MQRRFIFIYGLLFLVYFFCASHALADVTVNASLSHTSFPLDRMAQLTITVEGASRSADITLPEIKNISLHSRGQSSQINVINGTVSSSLAHNYLVQAAEPGNYTLAPVKVRISGKDYYTEPINFTVTSSNQKDLSSTEKNEQGLDEVAFLRISETAKHYLGEIVPITVKAYFNQRYRFDEISLPTLSANGVASPQIKGNPVKTQESINNRIYHVLTWDTSLSGVKVGRQIVKFTLDAALLIPQQRIRQSPFGDSFFDNFFGGYERKPISLASDEAVFTVLALPTTNKPDDFTGAIGDFTFEVTASPLSLTVGEPITLKMTITGQGNFDRIEAPIFPDNADWKTYTPTSEFSPDEDGNSGRKVFEQAIVVKNSAITEIPSLSLSYFDPVQEDYVTRVSAPLPIQLQSIPEPPAATQTQTSKAAAQPTAFAENNDHLYNMAPIHLETGKFQTSIEPLFKKTWYLLGCSIAIVSILLTMLLKRRRLQKKRHPAREQKRNRRLHLNCAIQEMSRSCGSGDKTKFLAECRRTIQQQLGLIWGIEPAAISSTDLSNRLPADSPLLEIFARAEAAAYGAVSISDKEMQSYMATISTELEKLI